MLSGGAARMQSRPVRWRVTLVKYLHIARAISLSSREVLFKYSQGGVIMVWAVEVAVLGRMDF